MSEMKQYIQDNLPRFTEELMELLRIPSVSADSKHNADTARCAEAVKEALLKAGCNKVEICPTPGHPIVYGEKIIDPELPTVLTYGHYDVQPPDPLDLWTSGPFDPIIKDN
ncbi:MAG: peptidase dimerization domain protein, partial [Saprospiraceae bacterium]